MEHFRSDARETVSSSGCALMTRSQVLHLFGTVWGLGPVTSETYYARGCRTLEDLAQQPDLPDRVRLGLKHHDDIHKVVIVVRLSLTLEANSSSRNNCD